MSAPTVQDPYNANRPNIDTDPRQPPPLPDLPPVEAPSAGFVVQLFVIPAVVVAVVILVWLLFGKLAGGERDRWNTCGASGRPRELAVGVRAGQPDPERRQAGQRPAAPRRADRPALRRAEDQR